MSDKQEIPDIVSIVTFPFDKDIHVQQLLTNTTPSHPTFNGAIGRKQDIYL